MFEMNIKLPNKKEEFEEIISVLVLYILSFFLVGVIESVSASDDGALYASVGSDKALKVFDVINFGKKLSFLIFLRLLGLGDWYGFQCLIEKCFVY